MWIGLIDPHLSSISQQKSAGTNGEVSDIRNHEIRVYKFEEVQEKLPIG
jgi:hypothetical protein